MASFHGREIAEKIDMDRYSVRVSICSAARTTAPQSLTRYRPLIHFDGTPEQKQELDRWLTVEPGIVRTNFRTDINRTDFGCSLCNRRGYKTGVLCDKHRTAL